MNILNRNDIQSLILKYGYPVLSSKYFQEAYYQPHHLTTTVAEHSINVAVISILIWSVLKMFRIKADLGVLILAALGHDLGMLCRDNFKNERETCKGHPIESVKIMKEIYPECDEKIISAIQTHMWPLCIYIPKSLEGFILTLSDKISATAEFVCNNYHCKNIVLAPVY